MKGVEDRAFSATEEIDGYRIGDAGGAGLCQHRIPVETDDDAGQPGALKDAGPRDDRPDRGLIERPSVVDDKRARFLVAGTRCAIFAAPAPRPVREGG
ncbi:MAG: hypothetical protein ISS15_05340 [Alphaproteobacteria bacterium]|nr:hypothetical protein [Alphaproteobacteria bacterium]MBL7097063.1 hypothetical protein [Alphaproteobacteria bacterium]